MNYKYNTRDGIINTWISFESYNDRVIIYNDDCSTEKETTLYNNAEGKLVFMYNGEEICFTDFISMSMAGIKSRIERGEHVFENEICQAIIHDGMENVRFAAKMPVPVAVLPGNIALCTDKYTMCECGLVEEYLSMPHDKYKIRLKPINDEIVCTDRKYTSDFVSLIKRGNIQILDSVDDGKTAKQHIVEYFSKVTSPHYWDFKVHADEITA